ncbi:translation initiation factor IF-2 subunit alpha [Picrophilus oshimae]|uniref:Protein translation initiation factor 2 subunit alpha n=1 Tax=Picrophilus torridus (strain ATCC 700027 / DSM 9790 / JCM 10055 / NBRC 100828 / KAW 2/3) TaxID=1122961 RepID=Q6L212_PICTO|nr:translation initiation factor IF-2 subunit alpha [Picrophilus oshimae]AAT42990.1 protein translation initiation factor 2 subunit alpha [Picrophilus oshimae DSM 9789]SMD30708.1 translation initiation factor 2 subunit alpha (aeIF-2a) [Picrophilus oshimae DSM 9789]
MKSLPDVGDLVVVTIKEIKNYGAIVTLDEYENVTGFIHITEVATGWIKHIKDYLKENQKTVCKVLDVDKSRRHVDLSLKRVNEHQRREKIEEWKNEEKAFKLLEIVANNLGISKEDAMKEFGDRLIENYGTLYDAFFDAASNDEFMSSDNSKWRSVFVRIARENIVIPKVEISGYLELYSLSSNGIENIKKVLENEESEDVTISYAGAPKYRIVVTESNYKVAEEVLKNKLNEISEKSKKNNVSYDFEREE